MAEDLSSFIEQQKIKLEKERADLSRNGNYTSTSQNKEVRRKESPRGPEVGNKHVEKESPLISKMNNNEETGLPLGGYEKIQQKLKEERRLEYNRYLAEKKLRSTGKVDSVLKERDISPSNKAKEESGRRSLEHSYEKVARESPAPRNRRKGKENWNINDNYEDDRGSLRYPQKESYEDILRRKRADERRYRGDRVGYDGLDLDNELRLMELSSRNYKYNSRSDGYLSRHYDDLDDEEFDLPYRRGRRRRDKSIESKRVRFYDEDDYEDMNDINLWSKPRRRLLNDYDDNEDINDLYALPQRRSRRSDRVSSAHAERSVNPTTSENESIRRTKTDSEIRSQSAPLLDGAGIIGGAHIETREMKIRRQEKYKRELDEQMKQRQENKKKEKLERLSQPDGTNGFDIEPHVAKKTPCSTSRTSAPGKRDDAYDGGLGNIGPSSRPPQHPSLYPSPYDDPYYYYGRQERGVPQATTLQDPLFKSSGNGVTGFYDTDTNPPDHYRDRSRQTDFSRTPAPRRGQGADHTHQPPGGYVHFGGISPEADDIQSKQSKRAAQQAYQEELKKQMEVREMQKRKEKEEREKYDKKMDEEIAKYDPWGKGGAGAPLRDITGQVIADLRSFQQDTKDGKTSVIPRNAVPSIDVRFENPPPQHQDNKTTAVNASPFGRSDPLKERQPNDDLKERAKLEYQQYLKLQVEEKERKKKEEQDKIRQEEEREERRLQEQRDKMQKEYLEEQEKIKKKEEEVKRQNELLLEAQNAKKREAEQKRKEMEEKRQEELRKKLEDNITTRKMESSSATTTFRTDSPPIPTMRKKEAENTASASARTSSSPPVPALAKLQNQDSSQQPHKPNSPSLSSVPQRQPSAQSRQRKIKPDSYVLSQLTALRQQLKNEEQKVQSQIGHSAAATKYSQMGRIENESRRSKRDVSVFDRALTNKPGTVRKTDTDHYSAADEFNRMKQEDTSSLAGEFRSRFPQPATTDSMLDLQQQEYLREQEDKLSSLKAGMGRSKVKPSNSTNIEGPSRSKSKDSLLESESQFIAVEDPAQMIPASQMDIQPRQYSARERRRWKQLEEMAKEPKPYDVYKPPTPGGFSLNSVTSFNVDDVAAKNEERLRRIQAIKRTGGVGENNDPDDVLKQFMSERRRPMTRASEASLEAETSYEPLLFLKIHKN